MLWLGQELLTNLRGKWTFVHSWVCQHILRYSLFIDWPVRKLDLAYWMPRIEGHSLVQRNSTAPLHPGRLPYTFWDPSCELSNYLGLLILRLEQHSRVMGEIISNTLIIT